MKHGKRAKCFFFRNTLVSSSKYRTKPKFCDPTCCGLASFFLGGGSRRHPAYWLSSKGPNYQREVLLVSTGAIEGHFEEKTPRERSPRRICSCRTMPRLTGHLKPRRNGPTWTSMSWSPTIFSGSGPVGLPPVTWTEKQLKVRHFSFDAEVIAAAETWLDGQYFFLVACKS